MNEVSSTQNLDTLANNEASLPDQVAPELPNEATKRVEKRKSNRIANMMDERLETQVHSHGSGCTEAMDRALPVNESGTNVPNADVDQHDADSTNQFGGGDTDFGGYSPDDSDAEDSDPEAKPTAKPTPNTKMLEDFKTYCNTHSYHFLPLTKEEKTQIKLLDTLKRHKAPLGAYKEVLEWHLKETKHLQPTESIRDTNYYCSRNAMMKKLINRYNCGAMVPKLKQLRLPHSKATVTIPYRDAQDCIVSLLTDPRVKDSDYLFYNQDPCAPPPEKITYLEDVNTGEAVIQSHRKLATEPNEAGLGISMYIDGAVTGLFSDLPVTALKIALGIHRRSYRDNPWAWRELAWIPQVRKHKARGKKLFAESQHMEAEDLDLMDGEGDYAESGSDVDDRGEDQDEEPAVKAQDFHTMLSFALESFVKLQETGFMWDVAAYGKVFAGTKFVLYVINVKCDTEEGDLLCGKYLVRTSNVQQICRYCYCPTEKADDFDARYQMKTQAHIERLIKKGDLAGLQQISQQNIRNAFYKVRFHAANDRGIHGACPSEMLHAILLGIFKYCRNIFFQHMGEESKLSADINGLAQMHGKLLTHQSDRDLPATNFGQGIQKGKLMAKQFRGVLLVMAATLRSTLGRRLLMKRKKFGKQNGLRDWTLLVELLLEWEAFLCLKRMKKSHVKRLAKKHRYIMYIMKNVAKRSEGMGLKIMKFHAIIHLVEDMILYGTPSEFDTGSNESHHKPTKVAAKLTQRKEATFNAQTAQRITEFLVIELAMLEVDDHDLVWEYFVRHTESTDEEDIFSIGEPEPQSIGDRGTKSNVSQTNMDDDASDSNAPAIESYLAGTKIEVFEDDDPDDPISFRILGNSKHKETTRWSTQMVDFLYHLQELVLPLIHQKSLPIRTELIRGEFRFRGHPNHRGDGPWRDWAIIDWGSEWGKLPSHIWCFVDLQGMGSGSKRTEYGGVVLTNDAYAVVEVATYDTIEENADLQSDLFVPITLEVGSISVNKESQNEVLSRKFYLAPVSAIVGPCIAIPDIGGAPNAYFQVKPRRQWAKEFISWLTDPHTDDLIMKTDNESVEQPPKKKAKTSKS